MNLQKPQKLVIKFFFLKLYRCRDESIKVQEQGKDEKYARRLLYICCMTLTFHGNNNTIDVG